MIENTLKRVVRLNCFHEEPLQLCRWKQRYSPNIDDARSEDLPREVLRECLIASFAIANNSVQIVICLAGQLR